MDLWIRSQNKEILIPNPKLALEDIETEYWIIDLCDDTVLGTYKSKERALEVLDEIQERLINLELVSFEEKGKARSDAFKKEYLRCVYEMPKE